MFDADQPIHGMAEDRLNRAVFAKYLARSLLDHNSPLSAVVGLYGGLGSGKTSVLNMVMEELHFAASNLLENEKPLFVFFNAWSYATHQHLTPSFFTHLIATLQRDEYFTDADQLAYLLETYQAVTIQQLPPRATTKKTNFISRLWSSDNSKSTAKPIEDTNSIKQSINHFMRTHKHKIIIIIDNLNQLNDAQIVEMFQLIKSLADFDHTLYLISADKNQLIKTLERTHTGGVEFLEKVVQLTFDVPPLLQQDLETIFADRMKHVMEHVPLDLWNAEYWADVYHDALKFFFHNCRDITRYVNVVDFSYVRVRDVVNPIDFFALTAIEMFMPELYMALRNNKDLFSDLFDNVYALTPEEIADEKIRCDEILALAPNHYRDIAYLLIMHLFPRIQRIYHPEQAFSYPETLAHRLRRICSPDFFNVYFRLTVPNCTLNASEFNLIMGLAKNRLLFDEAISRLNQDDCITSFLDQLDSPVLQTIPKDHILAIISALLDNGDLFPKGMVGLLTLDTNMRIHRIIRTLLQRFSGGERFRLMQKAIAQTEKSLACIIRELHYFAHQHYEEEATYKPVELRDFDDQQLTSLQDLATTRIVRWADNGSLADHPERLFIWHAWLTWQAEKCRQYIEELTLNDHGLISFLTAVLEKPINEAMTKYEKNPHWEDYLNKMQRFIEPKSIEAHAILLFENDYFEKLRESEQLSLMIFLDLMKSPTKKVIRQTSP